MRPLEQLNLRRPQATSLGRRSHRGFGAYRVSSKQKRPQPVGPRYSKCDFELLLGAVGGRGHVAAVLTHVTHARAVARRGRRAAGVSRRGRGAGVSRRVTRGVTSRRSSGVYARGRRGAVLLNEAGVRRAWTLTHGAVSGHAGGVRCGDGGGVAAIGRSTGLVLGTDVAGRQRRRGSQHQKVTHGGVLLRAKGPCPPEGLSRCCRVPRAKHGKHRADSSRVARMYSDFFNPDRVQITVKQLGLGTGAGVWVRFAAPGGSETGPAPPGWPERPHWQRGARG